MVVGGRTIAHAGIRDSIARLDGVTHIAGGWVDHHWVQLAYQLAGSIAGGVYSFCGSCVILALIMLVARWWPALELRVTEEEEVLGVDAYNGEIAVCQRRVGHVGV